jgi:hypothetical protein
VVDGGAVDLCSVDPGHDIDLYVTGALRSMTAVWMGMATLKAEIDAGRLEVNGDNDVRRSMHAWLGLSVFAKEKSRVSA